MKVADLLIESSQVIVSRLKSGDYGGHSRRANSLLGWKKFCFVLRFVTMSHCLVRGKCYKMDTL